jgi:hypothetical protein
MTVNDHVDKDVITIVNVDGFWLVLVDSNGF